MGSGWFDRSIDRRQFLIRGAVGTGAVALAACGGPGSGGSPNATSATGSANLTLSVWHIPGSLRSFQAVADKYHTTHEDVVVNVQATPDANFDEWLGARLKGGQAPDIIEVQYQQVGRHIQNGGLVDIARYLPANYGAAFLPSFWGSIAYRGGIYGIPHHTDTFATFYRTDVLKQVGVTAPDSLGSAWHWDEFLSIARRVKSVTGKYAIGLGFSGATTAYRWLPLLYMHGGRLVESDDRTPAIDSPQGVSALAWTQNLYRERLVPPDNTIRDSNASTARAYFSEGAVGLMLHGDWQLESLRTAMKDSDWGVTYMIQDAGRASDLGGNVLAVTRDCRNVRAAVDFLLFEGRPDNIRSFVTDNNYLPVLKALAAGPLPYSYRPDIMQRFDEQATTIPAAMAKVETSPWFGHVNLMMADQLDLCFTGQQTPAQTASAIAAEMKRLLS